MLSVQLSIIKLVFRDPCVVKARFVPWTGTVAQVEAYTIVDTPL